jgi:signal transduction histidine kinase
MAGEVLDLAERRLVRLGLDLHDGPVQDVAALLADVRFIRGNLGDSVPPAAAASLADVETRLGDLHEELRDLAHLLEARALVERPLVDVLQREAASFRSRSDIQLDLSVTGDVRDLTASQRIAIARIVQEAITNVRDHSGASRVWIRVHADDLSTLIQVRDNGCGFDPEHVAAETRRGGQGLRGIGERARLLDGSFELETRPGGPTALKVRLPRWRPPSVTAIDALASASPPAR